MKSMPLAEDFVFPSLSEVAHSHRGYIPQSSEGVASLEDPT